MSPFPTPSRLPPATSYFLCQGEKCNLAYHFCPHKCLLHVQSCLQIRDNSLVSLSHFLTTRLTLVTQCIVCMGTSYFYEMERLIKNTVHTIFMIIVLYIFWNLQYSDSFWYTWLCQWIPLKKIHLLELHSEKKFSSGGTFVKSKWIQIF